jgi:hypothetical protein
MLQKLITFPSIFPLLILLPNRRDVRGRWPVFKQVLKGMEQVENE